VHGEITLVAQVQHLMLTLIVILNYITDGLDLRGNRWAGTKCLYT